MGEKPVGTKHETAAGSAAATASKLKSITRKNVSPQEQQYLKAIAMSSAELGATILTPTERIAQHLGNALAHELGAKEERVEAQREFQQNIAFYYETKQRLLNPGYRTDFDGGKNRTPDENEKNFGAPDWATFANKCVAYSLQHADRLLKAFAKANGLLTDEGENIDDPEPKEAEGAGRPQGRRAQDPTAQKRYEFIATAAMELANRNPEGQVEKQILAAAECEPAPLMPISHDLFTEVLSFITQISTTSADVRVRAKALELVNKMRLHQPVAETAKVPAEAEKEEKRKRDKRLAKKNGQPLGSAACNLPTNGTSEHVQMFAPVAEGRESSTSEQNFAEYRLLKAKAQGECSQRNEQTELAAQAANPAAPQSAATPAPKQGTKKKARKAPASVKTKVCPPALSPEEEERKQETSVAASSRPGLRQGDFVLNENGKYEYNPEQGMAEADEIQETQPGGQPVPPTEPMASIEKSYRVKPRSKPGFKTDYLIIYNGDKQPYEVFDTECEAKTVCENLNNALVGSIVSQHTNAQSVAQAA
jgi:hypothetical protein